IEFWANERKRFGDAAPGIASSDGPGRAKSIGGFCAGAKSQNRPAMKVAEAERSRRDSIDSMEGRRRTLPLAAKRGVFFFLFISQLLLISFSHNDAQDRKSVV